MHNIIQPLCPAKIGITYDRKSHVRSGEIGVTKVHVVQKRSVQTGVSEVRTGENSLVEFVAIVEHYITQVGALEVSISEIVASEVRLLVELKADARVEIAEIR